MHCQWLHRHTRPCLLLFWNGFGMDARPFLPLTAASCDVLMISDYRRLRLPEAVTSAVVNYPQVVLVAWSMGVWAAASLLDAALIARLDMAVAVNGSLAPVSREYGIDPQVFQSTLVHWNEVNRQKFYRRMFTDRLHLQQFLNYQPARSAAEQQEELRCLAEIIPVDPPAGHWFQQIHLYRQDRIMLARQVQSLWSTEKIVLRDGGHFPFYNYSSWDALLDDCRRERAACV